MNGLDRQLLDDLHRHETHTWATSAASNVPGVRRSRATPPISQARVPSREPRCRLIYRPSYLRVIRILPLAAVGAGQSSR